MMAFSDWTGLSGLALIWMLLALRLPIAARFSARARLFLAVAIYCTAMLPLNGLSLTGWLRGMVGDLSITSVLLLGAALAERLRLVDPAQVWSGRERHVLLAALSVLALVLYPCALGIGTFDPYRLGYANGAFTFILALALLSLWSVRAGLRLIPLAAALAVAAWSVGWSESTNLWDYLIDAPLAIYALWNTLKLFVTGSTRRKHVNTEPQ